MSTFIRKKQSIYKNIKSYRPKGSQNSYFSVTILACRIVICWHCGINNTGTHTKLISQK